MPASLQPLLVHLPLWTLVLFRITGIFIVGPIYGSSLVPTQIKIFLALGLSFCIYPMLLGDASHPVSPALHGLLAADLSLWALAPMVVYELLIGLAIGYGATLPMYGLQIGGQIIDQQLGLSLAGVISPDADASGGGLVNQFYFLIATTLFVICNGHRAVLGVLVGSFDHVPLGAFRADARLIVLMTGLLESMFDLAIRVSAPLLCLVFLETIAMGFIARTVPQMNILSVGFTLRIMVGLLILIAGAAALASVYEEATGQALRRLTLFFGL